jgi:putative transcriptional regulator
VSRAGENAGGVRSLRGHLLVAGPGLEDPNFRRTVLLLGEHGEDGAMGVVLNHPTSVTVTDAVPPLASLVDGSDVVHLGGPVRPRAVVVLADFVDPSLAADLVLGTVGFLPVEIEGVADVGSVRALRVYAGYAGWSPGQLEDELAEGSWIVLPARVADIFTDAPERLWASVLRRQGGALAVLALLPDDPRVN